MKVSLALGFSAVAFCFAGISHAGFYTGFESPTYAAVVALDNQDGWKMKGGNAEGAVVADSATIKNGLESYGYDSSHPTPDGSAQALAFVGGVSGQTTTYYGHDLTGFTATSVVLASWDMRSAGLSGSNTGSWFVLDDGSASGPTSNNRAVAVRYSTSNGKVNVEYYSGGWKSTGKTVDAHAWHHFDVVADYSSKTFTLSMDGELLTSSAVAFYSSSSAIANEVTLFRGGADNGFLLDNINVRAVPEPLTLVAASIGIVAVIRRRKR